MTIYPLLIKPCAWQEVAWLAKMELRPKGEKAVASYKSIRAEEMLAGVAREIASIARARAQNSEQPEIKNQDNFWHPIEITIPPVESTLPTAPTTLDALTNHRLLELGIKKDRRYYKIHLRNRNKSKTIRNIRADLVDIKSLKLNSDIPLHLQSKNLLPDLKSRFPLRLCFTENREPPYKDHIDLSPEGEASIDVIRWEYDRHRQPTFFLCHTKKGFSAEIPLGKYRLRLKITADDVVGQEKTFVIGKRGQEFKLWLPKTTAQV